MQEHTWALVGDESQKLVEEWILEETTKALHSFKNNKTPGADGLLKEFCVTFWGQVILDLLEVYRKQLQEGHLWIRMDQGLNPSIHERR